MTQGVSEAAETDTPSSPLPPPLPELPGASGATPQPSPDMSGAPPLPPVLGAPMIGTVVDMLPHGMEPKKKYTLDTPLKRLNWTKVSKTTQHRSFDTRLTYMTIAYVLQLKIKKIQR